MSSMKMMPMALLDKCIGEQLWVIMKNKRQFAGKLLGFDDFLNMVLEEVTQIWYEGQERKSNKIEQLLLNGHDIAYMVPGTSPLDKIQKKKVNYKQK